MPDTIDIYTDSANEYRWRRQAANGEIISDSGESYTRRYDAELAAIRANADLFEAEKDN